MAREFYQAKIYLILSVATSIIIRQKTKRKKSICLDMNISILLVCKGNIPIFQKMLCKLKKIVH
ncbi:MAG: hypothetical protein CVT92_00535 [Bacteroidetes bacterium HGW-Bacteroidetes-1]|nr:MAG: hypothetical protein CVT92_00535 [Bacteroidetes bacterium HGW-Bacteroidetes-1]